jgi:hypothetical protein
VLAEFVAHAEDYKSSTSRAGSGSVLKYRRHFIEARLILGFGSQSIGAEVDLLAPLVHPFDGMAVLAHLHPRKILRILQIGEDSAACDRWTKIDNAFVPISPNDLEDAVNDGLC